MFLLGISEETAVAQDQTLLMIGTRKGLWIGRSDGERREWSIDGPYLPLMEVYSCMIDTRGERPRLLAGASLSWTGPQVFSSDDLGKTWQEHPIGFPEGSDASVERVWQLAPGPEDGVVYAGTEPGAIFRSTDNGETFSLEQQLWDHPHRKEWGAGFGGQAFHTLLPHPTTRRRSRLPSRPEGSTAPPTEGPRGSPATRASARTSSPRASSTPSSASACTR